jgi:uncharacterized protein (DUF302 family)
MIVAQLRDPTNDRANLRRGAMKPTDLECRSANTLSIAMATRGAEPKVSRDNIVVVHIRIDSSKPYDEARAALERLPKFDDRIRALLQYGEIARVKAELAKIQGDAGLVIFSVATHGEWLQIHSEKHKAAQYVIGNVLVSTQMTRHELGAGLYAPLRVMLYENKTGAATFEYDLPSSLFGQYGNEAVTVVAKALDQQIYDVLIKAAE